MTGSMNYRSIICYPLGKKVSTHSSIPAWGIPWTEEPVGLQSMGSQKVRHDLISKQQKQICYPQLKKKKTSGNFTLKSFGGKTWYYLN